MTLPNRSAALVALAFVVSGSAFAADAAHEAQMKQRAATAGCLTCHALTRPASSDKPVGPAWPEVAAQYRDKPGAAEFLTRVVLEGSNPYSSHWKNKVTGLAMPPNAVAITEADARQLVFWILSMK